MDALEHAHPPQVVLEELAPCRDRATLASELGAGLGPTTAPSADWELRIHFERAGTRVLGYGAVKNPHGAEVATRSLSADSPDCASLARGLGVWASLVLDAETERESAPPTSPNATDDPLVAPPAARAPAPWPPTEKRPPEADLFLKHASGERTVELGSEAFLMGGTGGGAILGPLIYGVFEAAHGFFLRPSILVGHSIGELAPTTEAAATFLASRFDACARVAGMYLEHRGIQLDLCAGADIGFSHIDSSVPLAGPPGLSRTLPFFGLGPSMGLRGELGNNLSASVRGVAEVSFLRDEVTLAHSVTPVSPPLIAGRAEVGLSWSLR